MASTRREKELARQRAERQAARRTAAGQRRRQRQAILASVVAVVLVAAVAVAVALLLRDDAPDDVASAGPISAPSGAAGADASGPADADASAGSSADPSGATGSDPSGAAGADASPVPGLSPAAPVAPDSAGSPPASPAPGTCQYSKTAEPPAKEVDLPPTEDVETEQVYEVTLDTSQGEIVFELDSAKAPCTGNSLRSLAHFTYFDDTPCHRLTTEGISVLQCGDPSGTGSGGPGYQFAEENLAGATYPRGTVAMARAGVGTNGSQFFLVYQDSSLPPNYTPFGTITAGLDVLDEVAKGGSDESNSPGDGKPNTAVQIETLRVKPKPA